MMNNLNEGRGNKKGKVYLCFLDTSFVLIEFTMKLTCEKFSMKGSNAFEISPNNQVVRVVARPILVVGNMSNFVGSLPRARGSTKLFMFNYGANIAEVGPCSQTVHVMGPCNKLNGLLIVFFLCDI